MVLFNNRKTKCNRSIPSDELNIIKQSVNGDSHTRCPFSYSAICSISSFIFSMFCRLFSSHSCPKNTTAQGCIIRERSRFIYLRIQDVNVSTQKTEWIEQLGKVNICKNDLSFDYTFLRTTRWAKSKANMSVLNYVCIVLTANNEKMSQHLSYLF